MTVKYWIYRGFRGGGMATRLKESYLITLQKQKHLLKNKMRYTLTLNIA